MATIGKIPGSKFLFFVNTTDDLTTAEPMGCARDVTTNFNAEEIEAAACRDDVAAGETGGWKEFSSGDKDATIDVSGFVKFDNPFNRDEIFEWLDSGDARYVWVTTEESGDKQLKAQAFPTSQSNSYPQGDFAGYDLTLRVTGEPVYEDIV